MHSLAWWSTLIVVGTATYTDLRSRRIPNWLVLPFLVAGVVASCWFSGWHGLGQSLAGMGLGALVYGFLFWMGGMGAGDVKLCVAIGAWIGPKQLLIALVLTSVAGGLMALGWMACAGFLKNLFRGPGALGFWRRKQETGPDQATESGDFLRRKMPYAPAIAIGTLISFFAR
jgi:prepilin peptidase CpaA